MAKKIRILLANHDQKEASVIVGMLIYGLKLFDLESEIVVVSDGESAWSKLQANELFDVVITDLIFMKSGEPFPNPEKRMTGCTLLKKIQAEKPKLPVIAFTLFFSLIDEATQAHFNTLIFKDGIYMKIIEAVNKAISKN